MLGLKLLVERGDLLVRVLAQDLRLIFHERSGRVNMLRCDVIIIGEFGHDEAPYDEPSEYDHDNDDGLVPCRSHGITLIV
jgi:hypothetical protein